MMRVLKFACLRKFEARPKGSYAVTLSYLIIASALVLPIAHTAAAQVYAVSTIETFNGSNGNGPNTTLQIGSTGYIYGSTNGGGSGTVFDIAPGTHSMTTIATFAGAGGNGPNVDVVTDSTGNLVVTAAGGAAGTGAQYAFANTGSAAKPIYGSGTAIASFAGSTAPEFPYGNVALDAKGNIYGTTTYGGIYNSEGTVYEVANSGTVAHPVYASNLSLLDSFNGTDGANPYGALTIDKRGNILGTADEGGVSNAGTIFEIAAGTNAITSLASFTGTNGRSPLTGLTTDANGNLFGTTAQGGGAGGGTIYEIANLGTAANPVYSSVINTLLSFSGLSGGTTGGVTIDASGNLYGTYEAGAAGYGGVYELANIGTSTNPAYSTAFTSLAAFNNTNGAYPLGAVVLDSAGNIYGTTDEGGANNDGTVFELTRGTSGAAAAPEPESLALLLPVLLPVLLPPPTIWRARRKTADDESTKETR